MKPKATVLTVPALSSSEMICQVLPKTFDRLEETFWGMHVTVEVRNICLSSAGREKLKSPPELWRPRKRWHLSREKHQANYNTQHFPNTLGSELFAINLFLQLSFLNTHHPLWSPLGLHPKAKGYKKKEEKTEQPALPKERNQAKHFSVSLFSKSLSILTVGEN